MSARGAGAEGGRDAGRGAAPPAARGRHGDRDRKDARDLPDPEALRRVTDRAIRRLGMMETLILAGAAVAALAGGALAAFLAANAFGWPFRPAWAAASLIFFVAPGAAAWVRSARNTTSARRLGTPVPSGPGEAPSRNKASP